MSSNQYNAGQATAHAQAKTEHWVDSAHETANKACDKISSNPHEAQRRKEESAGFLQQAAEQVKNVAQGAVEGVKNSLGINDKK
ncbi:Malate dehydrogenase (decarboxylating) [Bertholletia excelsa]